MASVARSHPPAPREDDLADVGDITSAMREMVVAVHTIIDVEDLGRRQRQVHRILKPSMPLVIAVPQPFTE